MEEEWRDVVGYEGLYQVSNLGRIKSIAKGKGRRSGRILINCFDAYGYLLCSFCRNGVPIKVKVHRIVAFAFLNPPLFTGERYVVDHINGDRSDNNVENIRFVTHRYNVTEGFRVDMNKYSSKYTGVSKRKGDKTWRAAIWVKNKCKDLGHFENEIDAHYAYQNELFNINKNIQNNAKRTNT